MAGVIDKVIGEIIQMVGVVKEIWHRLRSVVEEGISLD